VTVVMEKGREIATAAPAGNTVDSSTQAVRDSRRGREAITNSKAE